MSVASAGRWSTRPGENLSSPAMCAAESGGSGVYRPGPVTGADDLALMRRIDELHLKWPFYGSREWCSNSPRQATASTEARAKADGVMGSRRWFRAPAQQSRRRPQDLSLSAAAA